jgi:hypothetical protein
MTRANLSLIPLSVANLCLDCEMITATRDRCVSCGSAALLNLAKTLSRNDSVELRAAGPEFAPVTLGAPARYGDYLQST